MFILSPMRILIVLMLLFAGATQAQTDTLAEALRAQEAGDYARAATLFIPLASKGDPVAQFNLGVIYTQGQIILKDYPAAMQWYLAAAEQGHAQAQANLGELYATGKGMPQDFKKSMHWLISSAKLGNSSAQLHLGEMYTEGRGVPQNFVEAIRWYRLSADQGNAIAHSRLAECYENGQGVPQDSLVAIRWLNTAAANATDMSSRNAYLARRDAIAKGIESRQIAKERQLAKETAERAKAAEAVKAEEARIEAEKAASARAAEKAMQKAAADAALEAQIQAYKQAKIEAKATKLKEQQEAIRDRLTASARRKAEHDAKLKAVEDRRRAAINAEVARHQAELKAPKLVKAKAPKVEEAPKAAEAKAPNNNKIKTRHAAKIALTNDDLQHPLLHEPQSPDESAKERRIREKSELVKTAEAAAHAEQPNPKQAVADASKPKIEQHKPQPRLKTNVTTGKMRYPAKIELTDEELGHAQSPNTTEPAKAPVK